ncbi:hypothetical protein KC963_00630 [Candidatus Saccharibacteria bacterium]|nr:hypothetical protein [Candidatus Saccharibacteria bacterium]
MNDNLDDYEQAIKNKIYEYEKRRLLDAAITAESIFSLDELEEYAELQRINRLAERE